MPKSSSTREPLDETHAPRTVQEPRTCVHDYRRESQEGNLTAYVCDRCGRGLLIDEAVDSIANY